MGLLDIFFKHKSPCCDSRGHSKIEVVAEFPYDVNDDSRTAFEKGDYVICHCKNCDRYFVSGEAAGCNAAYCNQLMYGVYVDNSGHFGAYCKKCNYISRDIFISPEQDALKYEIDSTYYYNNSPIFERLKGSAVRYGNYYMITQKWAPNGHYKWVRSRRVLILW